MAQVTTQLLNKLRVWDAQLNKHRGAAPLGYALAHMAVESGGDATTSYARGHLTGIMRVTWRTAKKYDYSVEDLLNPTINIYCWGRSINEISRDLYTKRISLWTKPNQDFWLNVRLVYVLGIKSYEKLLDLVLTSKETEENAVDKVLETVQYWVRNNMKATQHVGSYKQRELAKKLLNLQGFTKAMEYVNEVSDLVYFRAPSQAPDAAGTEIR